MTDDDRGQTVVTHVGSCRCPGAPHASGETVYFAPECPMALGAAGTAALGEADSVQEAIGLLAPLYLRFGIVGWTCLGEDGPLAVTLENTAARFPWADGGAELVDRADTLYAKDLMAPLVKRRSAYSGSGPTELPTSAIPANGLARPKPSRPSSRSTSEAGKPFVAPAP